MTPDVGDVGLETIVIKHLPPDAQAARIRALVPKYVHYATAIRATVTSKSGAAVQVTLDADDETVVSLALLATVFDDIATVPDAGRRAALLETQEKVALALNLDRRDIWHFVRHAAAIARILAG